MASSTEAQIKDEIARLTASINQHKFSTSTASHSRPPYRTNSRSNTYVNPSYKPPTNKYIRPAPNPPQHPLLQVKPPPAKPVSTQVKDVVINGIAFESSGRSLVRKDLPKPAPSASSTTRPLPPQVTRKSGHLIPTSRVYKPKSTRGRPMNRNMTLTNTTRPYQTRRGVKRSKYVDKPCPRFTTTGSCSRGLTCPYQHDPSKIAICWNFLQGNCSNTADSCNLSHDPTPERTPLCVHFVTRRSCNRQNCPFPHVNVGARQGVCRDFAVLGFCAQGLDCDKQHVRECPDFAEKGTCSTKGCKLPHVIRANRTRKPTSTAVATSATESSSTSIKTVVNVSAGTDDVSSFEQQLTAKDAQLGDEYISLTFNESESDEESEEVDESEDDDEEGDEEGSDPNIDGEVEPE